MAHFAGVPSGFELEFNVSDPPGCPDYQVKVAGGHGRPGVMPAASMPGFSVQSLPQPRNLEGDEDAEEVGAPPWTLLVWGADGMVTQKDQGLCSSDECGDARHFRGGGSRASKALVESSEANGPKEKRKRARGSQHTKASKKTRAAERPVANERALHVNKAAYATAEIEVWALKHSGAAYAGNVTKQGSLSLPEELGCGYRRLKYVPG